MMDKREIELVKQNILKDRRRRLLYLNPEMTEGKHIMEQDMKFFSTLKNGSLIGLLIFLVLFGILAQSLTLSLGIMLFLMIGSYLYLNFVFLPKRKTIKLAEQDIEKTKSYDFIKALEANRLSQIIIVLVLALMIFMRLLDTKKPLVGFDFQLARFCIIYLFTYAAVLMPKFIRLRKQKKTVK